MTPPDCRGFYKNKFFLTYILFCFFIFISCDTNGKTEENLNESLYIPSISEGFEIKTGEHTENVLINIKDPWQGANGVIKQFLIIRDDSVPDNYNGPSYIIGEAKRIVCMSSTHIAMLDALGAVERIVGVSGMPYISNPYIRANEKKIPDVGYEGNMDYESLIAARPDLVLLFSINGESSLEKKLQEIGIPYLYIGDYVEEDPLGKSEWLIPLAEVIGVRENGIKLFEEICERYNLMKQKVSSIDPPKPKVMLNAPFGDSWFMPSSKSYVARLVEDAGGDYIYNKDTGSSSMPIDMEEAYLMVNDADLWLNPGTFKSLSELKTSLPKFKDTRLVNFRKVYNNNKVTSPGGGNDCYESGVVNPDLILRDLIKIFHPEIIEEDFVYYQKLN